MQEITRVHVCDMPMGCGKSSAAISMMNDNPGKHYIYVTPYLEETERIVKSCYEKFVTPSDKNFGTGMNKSKDFLALIRANKNIATTHSLFTRIGDDVVREIKDRGYIVILDEVIDVFHKVRLSEFDIDLFVSAKILIPQETEAGITYLYNQTEAAATYTWGVYTDFFDYARSHSLRHFETTDKAKTDVYFWGVQPSLFTCAEETYVLTYMFEGSLMKGCLGMNNIKYDTIGVAQDPSTGKYSFSPNSYIPDDFRQSLSRIHIYEKEGPNEIGARRTSLSATWYKNAKEDKLGRVEKNIYNYFRHARQADPSDCIVSVPCAAKSKILTRRYSKQFVPFNARATNKYGNVHNLAYCVNVFFDPDVSNFMKINGSPVDADAYALSCLIQWVWRSAIRNGEDVYLYLPSARMRDLFEKWRSEIVATSP